MECLRTEIETHTSLSFVGNSLTLFLSSFPRVFRVTRQAGMQYEEDDFVSRVNDRKYSKEPLADDEFQEVYTIGKFNWEIRQDFVSAP